MKKRLVLAVLSLVLSGIFLYGCYTILTHPTVEGEEDVTYSGNYYRENCTDCHGDYHSYPYGYYYGYYPDYYWNQPRWGHYYNYPWWWDWYRGDYFWYDDDGEHQTEEVEKGERRRSEESLAPPYIGGSGVVTPVITEPKSKESVKVIKKVAKEGKEVKQEEKKEETQEEKKKEEKPPRRRK